MEREDNYSVAQKVWEGMLHLAMPVVQAYWTDLWHDAIVLDKKFPKSGEGEFPTEPVKMMWVVREQGTWLFETSKVDASLEKQMRAGAEKVFMITVTPDPDRQDCMIEWVDVT